MFLYTICGIAAGTVRCVVAACAYNSAADVRAAHLQLRQQPCSPCCCCMLGSVSSLCRACEAAPGAPGSCCADTCLRASRSAACICTWRKKQRRRRGVRLEADAMSVPDWLTATPIRQDQLHIQPCIWEHAQQVQPGTYCSTHNTNYCSSQLSHAWSYLCQSRVPPACCCNLCQCHWAAARVAERQVQRAALVVVVVRGAVCCDWCCTFPAGNIPHTASVS